MVQTQADSIKQNDYLTVIKLARQHNEEGLFSQAEDFYKKAITIARNLFVASRNDKDGAVLIKTLNELVSFYSFHGKDKFNRRLWLEILELGKDTFIASDRMYIDSVLGLASIKEKEGEITQAETLYKNLLQKQEKLLGPEALEICSTIKEMGAFYFRQQNYGQAEIFYLKALAIEEFHLGTCSAQINATVDALANIFRKQKKWRLAEYMLIRQKDILNILHGAGSLCATSCELRLAELFRQSGQIEKAVHSYGTVLTTYIKMFGVRAKPVLSLQKKLDQLSLATISFVPNDVTIDRIKTSAALVPPIIPVAVIV